jgi:excisionase family DNA binding protein
MVHFVAPLSKNSYFGIETGKCRLAHMELLTTEEAADYLRLKERKLYELVAARAIPCTKVTGRWLFPKADLDRWVASGLSRPGGVSQPDPVPIVGGSHDPLLEWALRDSGSGLAMLAEGSEAGLARFCKGEVIGAAMHLHSIDRPDVDANVLAIRSQVGLQDSVLIAFASREQGLLVRSDDLLGLQSLEQVVRTRARIAFRPRGAGAQLLLLSLLKQSGRSPDELVRAEPDCPTGPDIAQAIRAGRADCGIATRAVASGAGLGFVPLVWERFDLLLRQRDYFRDPMQRVIRFVGSAAMQVRAREMGGYDLTSAGAVRYVP